MNVKVTENVQLLLDTIEKPIAVIDLHGKILKSNRRFTNIFEVQEQGYVEQIVADKWLISWRIALQQTIREKKITCEMSLISNKTDAYKSKVNLHFDEKNRMIVVYVILPMELKSVPTVDGQKTFKQLESLEIISDCHGQIQEIKGVLANYFGELGKDFPTGKVANILSLFPKDTLKLPELERRVRETGYVETVQQYRHPSQHIRYYKITIMKDFSSDLYFIRIGEKTDEAILQQKLTHKDSLLEVGQLAASVAHEIRNPITTLKGFTQLLKITAEEETLKYLNVIEDEIQRMELILSEMLNLSKPVVDRKEFVSLKDLLMEIMRVIQPKATLENIKVIQNQGLLGERLLLGEEGRLKQVFLNLLKNSLESMEPGGTLTIDMQDCEENRVNIIIRDTGKGIEEQNLNQIFMPYFTTRTDGTGLGLPFVLQTIEDHGGTVSVSSKVGQGTSFILTLPVTEQCEVAYVEAVGSDR